MPLSAFTPQVRTWFENAFEAPTPAQAQAWPADRNRRERPISAPTGSGKTLAAFLWALDKFVREASPSDEPRTRLVYVSPLKALSYDIERNLRNPLRGLGLDVSVAIRTGDTPARERAAMLRHPPDILITTPESLYLMLTSRARELLGDTEAVILDEIHAVAATKRGAHLAAVARATRRAASRRAAPADRPVGDPAPARGGRALHGRPRAHRDGRRRRLFASARSGDHGAGRVDGGAGAAGGRGSTRSAAGR